MATTGSSTNPYQFAATSGYRDDGDAGLLHVGARYYDPQVGRFLTRDTYLEEHPYLYCEHDPVNHVDPSGHQGESLWDRLKRLGGKVIKLLVVPLVVEAGAAIHRGYIELEGKERMRDMYRDWVNRGGQDNGDIMRLLGPQPGDFESVGGAIGLVFKLLYR